MPHGALHYLPWAALPRGDGYVVDDWELRIAPSTSTLAFLGSGTQRGSGALALGNPALDTPALALPGAEAEARAIARGFADATLLTGTSATETAVRQIGGGKDVVHLASHGVFDPTAPLSSSLLLTADGEHDGRLSAAELYEMELQACLVTLSACESGLGRILSGDDVLGLTRGLLFAGASSMNASQWLIDDAATADLMTNLYAIGSSGATSSSALRAAQRAMIASGKEHPYYWAAFQVTGAR